MRGLLSHLFSRGILEVIRVLWDRGSSVVKIKANVSSGSYGHVKMELVLGKGCDVVAVKSSVTRVLAEVQYLPKERPAFGNDRHLAVAVLAEEPHPIVIAVVPSVSVGSCKAAR